MGLVSQTLMWTQKTRIDTHGQFKQELLFKVSAEEIHNLA